MREIKLTQNKIALVDDEDFDYLSQYKWYAQKTKIGYYAVRGVFNGKNMSKLLMHRVISKTPIDKMCDHLDHNTLNNQKSNLRDCSNQMNQMNRSSSKNSTSKFKGVHFTKNRWIASCTHNKIKIHIGCFKTEDEAGKAYDEKIKDLHNEFANLNFK